MRYKAIVFDVSDTLVEYRPNYREIFSDRLRHLGFSVDEETSKLISKSVHLASGEQTCKQQNGSLLMTKQEFNRMLDEAALACVINEYEDKENYLNKLSLISLPQQEMFVISGVFETLNILKEKFRLAIVSNHYSWLMEYLKECGLAQYFETVVISEIVGFAKPDKRIMQFVLEELSLSAEDCLYVGDHPLDVLCAKETGMDCVWIAPEDSILPEIIPFKEDYKIKSVNQLLSILLEE